MLSNRPNIHHNHTVMKVYCNILIICVQHITHNACWWQWFVRSPVFFINNFFQFFLVPVFHGIWKTSHHFSFLVIQYILFIRYLIGTRNLSLLLYNQKWLCCWQYKLQCYINYFTLLSNHYIPYYLVILL